MGIEVSTISEKYINQLGNKKVFNTVGFNQAASSIKQAVEETANAAKKEIETAIELLKSKVSQQDEFITQTTQENETLKDKNNSLEQSVTTLKSELKDKEILIEQQKEEQETLIENNEILEAENKSFFEGISLLRKSLTEMQDKLRHYKEIVKEAYKQEITPEIKEQKRGLSAILSGLILQKGGAQPVKETKLTVETIQENPVQLKQTKKVSKKTSVNNVRRKKDLVSKDIITQIEQERINQRLDKTRMDKASDIIKYLLGDSPEDGFDNIQEQFQTTKKKYLETVYGIINGRYHFENDDYGKIRIGTDENGRTILIERGSDFNGEFRAYRYEIYNPDGSSIGICDLLSDSDITFRDKEGKEFLKIRYGDHYSISISDKNGRFMVAESIRNGVIKYLNVNFNDVKPIPAIENDAQINAYAEDLISKAKTDCSRQQSTYQDTTDIDYINSDGRKTVHEYYINKKSNPIPVFTYLYNPNEERLEKLISTGDFGIHAKFDEKQNCFVQYRTKGITHISKYRKNEEAKAFDMSFYKNTENEHFETQSLYDENYESDKDASLQKAVYEKRNYGLASHPLTKAFTFYDLSRHKIKPWDFSILSDYIK